jgi:hypothetical protein
VSMSPSLTSNTQCMQVSFAKNRFRDVINRSIDFQFGPAENWHHCW